MQSNGGQRGRYEGYGVMGISPFAVLVGITLSSCAMEPTPPPPPAATSPTTNSDETELAVLPNNLSVQSGRNKITAVRRDGETAWELTLPQGDDIVAPVASALNSTIYVRGAKGLYAASPDGKWLWSKSLESRSFSKTRSSDMPVTFLDSTVAVTVRNDIIRFDDQGAVRWRFAIPEGHVKGRLTAAMDGALLVPTTAGLYCLTPDGHIAWRKTIGG